VTAPVTAPRKTVLIGGGARSGKTAFALRLARGLGERRVYIATATAGDGEMAARIARHRQERGAAFETVEEPLRLPRALRELARCDVVVVDCLTLWLSNLLLRDADPDAALREADDLADLAPSLPFHLLLVTNEVGMGLVPETPLGRMFRDVAGRVHQRLARVSDEIYLAALGVMLRLHPAPLQAVMEEAAEPRGRVAGV
jgi:adenosylcobinamide kinase/adenosylcobinamide-phosphate guanylyltransferase